MQVRLVLLGESQEVAVSFKGGALGMTLRDHDGPEDGAGVKIVDVTSDGRAAAAGITAGDTLLSVNDQLCTDHTQAIALIEACKEPTTHADAPAATIKFVIQSKYSSK